MFPGNVTVPVFQQGPVPSLLFTALWPVPQSTVSPSRFLKPRRLGLFQVVIRSMVQKIPSLLYTYLSANTDWILNELSSHYSSVVMLNISRFLLDIPLDGTSLPLRSLLDNKAWWGDNHLFCDRFASLLADPSTSPNASQFFTSLLYRAFFTPWLLLLSLTPETKILPAFRCPKSSLLPPSFPAFSTPLSRIPTKRSQTIPSKSSLASYGPRSRKVALLFPPNCRGFWAWRFRPVVDASFDDARLGEGGSGGGRAAGRDVTSGRRERRPIAESSGRFLGETEGDDASESRGRFGGLV